MDAALEKTSSLPFMAGSKMGKKFLNIYLFS